MTGKRQIWQRIAAWLLIFLCSSQPVLAATQVEIDPSVDKGKQPQITQAPNGTPMVNIATPNGSGLSYNRFLNFQVGSNGLILNNSRVIANTQLAGFVPGNPLLGQGSALSILNEVSGRLPSQLNGQVEIAGTRANFILANANGIVGNGFGIVNANRVILTTGTPVYGGSGSLEAFRVSGGQISVEGDGITAKAGDADQVELMARAVRVNAGVWGNTVKVVTGANQIGFTNGAVTPLANADPAEKPAVALDVSAIGGMYANKIVLIGSESGVGVNLAAGAAGRGRLIASGGDIEITNTGKVVLAGVVASNGNLTVTTKDSLVNSGSLYSSGDTSLFAADRIENKTGGNMYSRGNLLIAASADKDAQGNYLRTGTILNESARMEAEGNIDLNAAEVINKRRDFTYGQHVVQTTYPSFGITPIAGFDSAIRHYTQTILEGDIRSDSGAAYMLAGRNISVRAASLDNHYSTIAAGKDFNFTLDRFTNIGYQNTNVTIKDGQDTHKKTIAHHTWAHLNCWDEVIYHNVAYYDKITVKIPDAVPGVVSAGGAMNGTTGTMDVIVYGPDGVPLTRTNTLEPAPRSSVPDLSMPDGGQYQKPKETAHYLIETNPVFINKEKFLSSDYMLNLIACDPDKVQKRLGDGWYEQKLVRDQVTQLTGRRYLGSYGSSEEQYRALLDAGAQYAQKFQLKLGVALTAEQMASLTSDMVWLVEKEVNGQKALVPIVYLAKAQDNDLRGNGALVAAQNINIVASQNLKNSGVIVAKDRLTLDAKNITNSLGSLSGQNVTLLAKENIQNQGGNISGKDVTLDAAGSITNETGTESFTKDTLSVTQAGPQAKINATNNLNLIAKQDVNVIGGTLKAGADLTVSAGGNLKIDAVEETSRQAVAYRSSASNQDISKHMLSDLTAGNNVVLLAGADASLRGAQVEAGSQIGLQAKGDVKIQAVKDRTLNDASVGDRGGDYFTRYLNDDEAVRGSNLKAEGNVTVIAGTLDKNNPAAAGKGNLLIEGSNLTSKTGGILAAADRDISVKEVGERHEALAESRITNVGLLSSKTTDTYDHSINQQVKGSTLSGEILTVASGNDLKVKAGNLVATGDVSLTAKGNVEISSAAESYEAEHYKKTTTSGIFGSGGFGFTIGKKSEKTTLDQNGVNQVASAVGSSNGKVSIASNKDIAITASDIIGAKGVDITAANNVTIDAGYNTANSKQTYEFKQTGLSVSLDGSLVNAVQNTMNNVQGATESKDSRLKAVYAWKAANEIKDIGKQFDKATGTSVEDKNGAFNISLSFGSQQQKSENTSQLRQAQGSNIQSDEDIRIKANTGNIDVVGSTVKGKTVDLEAGKDINLIAANNTSKETSTSSSSSTSFGVSMALNGTLFNPKLDASRASSNGNGNVLSHANAKIIAQTELNIKAHQDFNMNGAQASAQKVNADVGRNLNLASRQDQDNYHEKTNSTSLGIAFGPGSSITGSNNRSKTDSDYVSVTEQTGIYAGKDGFTINVKNNTDLKGAVIDSNATPDKNKLTTGTLTWSDLHNKAQYSASSTGFSVSLKDGNFSGSPTPGMPVKGSADSTTHSGIANGTITINDKANQKQDVSTLNRDPKQVINALGKIFDKADVQERQQLANLFAQEAFKAVGDIASRKMSQANAAKIAAETSLELANNTDDPERAKFYKDNAAKLMVVYNDIKKDWDESGTMKILLHGAVGGIVADFSGGSFLSGFASAGSSEALRKELAKLPTGLHTIVAGIIGGVAAKITGGDSDTGTTISISGKKNNFDMPHPDDLSARDIAVMAIGGIDAMRLSDDAVAELMAKAIKDIVIKDAGAGTISAAQFVSDKVVKVAELPGVNKLGWAKKAQTADIFVQFPGEIVKQKMLHYDDPNYTAEMAIADAFEAKGYDAVKGYSIDKAVEYVGNRKGLSEPEKYLLKKIIEKLL